jgi:uncharacterized protein (DUF305 family)
MRNTIIVGVLALIIGVVGSGAVAAYAVNGSHTGLMKAYAMNMPKTTTMQMTTTTPASGSAMSMSAMTASLQGKTGDTFDKLFISEMETHHQGAIDMANLALTNAKHQEVKDLAKNIITAQTSEINQMKMWQAEWGYTTSSSNSMSGMGM